MYLDHAVKAIFRGFIVALLGYLMLLKPVVLWAASAKSQLTEQNAIPALGQRFVGNAAVERFLQKRLLVLVRDPMPLQIKVGTDLEQRDVRIVTGMMRVAAPVTAVRQRIMDFEAYTEYFSSTEEVRILHHDQNTTDVAFRLGLKVGMVDLGVSYTSRYKVDTDGSISWRVLEGDLAGSLGRWEFVPISGGRETLVLYSAWTNNDEASFVIRMIYKAQPDMKFAMPAVVAATYIQTIATVSEAAWNNTTNKKQREGTTAIRIPLLVSDQYAIEALQVLAQDATALIVDPMHSHLINGEYIDLQFVTAAKWARASGAAAKKHTLDFESYPSFFSQVKRVTVKRSPSAWFAKWQLGIDLGILSLPITYTQQYVLDHAESIPYRTVAGDIQYIYGAYEWLPAGEDRSLVIFTAASDPGKSGHPIVKLQRLVPRSTMLTGIVATGVIVEKLVPWIESQID